MRDLGYWQKCVGPGWSPLVRLAYTYVKRAGGEITQVKEKFGALRVYFYLTEQAPQPSRDIYEWIDDLEELSMTICEYCGAPGELRAVGWYKTRCDTCEANQAGLRDGSYSPPAVE